MHVLIKRERLSDWGWGLSPIDTLTRLQSDRDMEVIKPEALLIQHAATSYLIANELDSYRYLSQKLREWFVQRTRYKAERVRLALLAYRVKEGQYPKSLDQLSPEYMAPHDYQDPYSTGPFGYAAQGFQQRLYPQYHDEFPPTAGAPNTPVLWSVGTGGAQPTLRWMVREENDNGTMEETIVERDSEYAIGKDGEEVLTLSSSFSSTGAFWLPLPK